MANECAQPAEETATISMQLDVALVSLPFGPLSFPSLALSLFKTKLAQTGLRTRVFYFMHGFAQAIGPAFYHQISDGDPARTDLVGEWIFSAALFGSDAASEAAYIEQVLLGGSAHHRVKKISANAISADWIAQLLRARSLARKYILACVDEILRCAPRVVGITSMFETHTAALAFASALKDRAPDIFVVLGGSNCDGIMGVETARQFGWLDAVVCGEADELFPALAAEVVRGGRPRPRRGLILNQRSHLPIIDDDVASTATPTDDLDALPYPEFDDFFAAVKTSGYERWGLTTPHIVFETARGCWWGQKHHCTFCGLNGTGMRYRSKSGPRALEELEFLVGKYPGRPIAVADNILDHQYFHDFLPALASRRLPIRLFYEVKSNLRREQLELLKAAGIWSIQPGIESFSDQVLALMRKGVSGLQNIQLLKWCAELGITPAWGLLWGFPGEEPGEYQWMSDILRRLSHLQPPTGETQIRLDRFSPNHFDARQLGFRDVEPFPAYQYVYPTVPPSGLRNLAYFCSYDYVEQQPVNEHLSRIRDVIAEWRASWGRSALFHIDGEHGVLVFDLRACATRPVHWLSGQVAQVYRQASRVTRLATIGERLALSAELVDAAVTALDARELIVRRHESILALSLDLASYHPSPQITIQLVDLFRTFGARTDLGELIIQPDKFTEVFHEQQ